MKTFKKALAVVMCVVMTLTAAPLSGFVGIELPAFATKSKAIEASDLPADFDLAKYNVKTIFSSEYGNGIPYSIFYDDISKYSCSKVSYNAFSQDADLVASVEAWEAIRLIANPSHLTEHLEYQQQYEEIIFAVLFSALKNEKYAEFSYSNMLTKVTGLTDNLLSTSRTAQLLDKTSLDGTEADEIKDIAFAFLTDGKDVESAWAAFGEYTDIVKKCNSIVDKSISTVVNAANIVTSTVMYVSMLEQGEQILTYLTDLKTKSPNSVFGAAVSTVINTLCQDWLGVVEKAIFDSGFVIGMEATEKLFDYAWSGCCAMCPFLGGMAIGEVIGTLACNILFSTESLIEQFEYLKIVTQLETAACSLYQQYGNSCKDSVNSANAEKLMFATDFSYALYNLGAEAAVEMMNIACNKGVVNKVANIFGVGREHSFDEFEESVEICVNSFEIGYSNMKNYWKFCIEEDYPEFFVEVSEDEVIAPKYIESINIEKDEVVFRVGDIMNFKRTINPTDYEGGIGLKSDNEAVLKSSEPMDILPIALEENIGTANVTIYSINNPEICDTIKITVIGEEDEGTTEADSKYVTGKCGNNLTWTLNKSTGRLTIAGGGAMYDYGNYTSSYSQYAPWNEYRSYIKNIVIDNNVTSIGHLAFNDCDNLISLIIPDNITTIGNEALMDCDNLISIYIGKRVTTISNTAFYGCNCLTSITMSSNVNIIGTYAFMYCPINNVYYTGTENQWKKISIWSGNESLTKSTIHFNYDQTMHSHTFVSVANTEPSCTKEGSITFVCKECCISYTNAIAKTAHTCSNNWQTTKQATCTEAGTKVKKCVACGEIIQTEKITATGHVASSWQITKPATCAETGTRVKQCTACGETIQTETITETGHKANGWQIIKQATCTETGTQVKKCAVCNVTLETYTIPKTNHIISEWQIIIEPTNIKDGKKLKKCICCGVTIEEAAIPAKNKCGDNLIWTFNEKTGILEISGTGAMWDWDSSDEAPWYKYCDSIKEVLIGDNVTTISNYSFDSYSNLTTITIGNGVTTIGEYAFESCKSLTSIIIPDSVITIGYCAFRYCDNLSSVTIGNGVTIIDHYAFESCKKLTSIALGDSVSTIGHYAFVYCHNLTDVYYTGDIETWLKISLYDGYDSSSNPMYYADNFYINGVLVTNLAIPSNITIIPEYAFYGWECIETVTIPDGVTTISDYAFTTCLKLTNISISNSVTTIGDWAFWRCDSLASLTIPDGVITIGEHAFYDCGNLVSVIIGNGVTTISEQAFADCKKLINVTIPDSVATIDDWAFSGCTSLTCITIPDSVINIGYGAFRSCTSLTSLTIPDSVATIGDLAFYDCKSLTGVIISDSVTTIGDSTFCGCTNLTCVTIGSSVKTIGENAFSYCYKLTDITIFARVTAISKDAFNHCDALTDVYYNSTEADWNKTSIDLGNEPLLNATIHFNYDPAVHTHTYTSAVATVATCTNEGVITHTCKCGDSYTETIPQRAHTPGEWGIIIEATIESDGLKIKKCTICGATIEEKVIPKYVEPEIDDTVVPTPSQSTINYGDSIVLHIDAEKIPEGGYVEWTASNNNFTFSVSEDSSTCTITPSASGETTFTATIYDEDGRPVATDEQVMTAKASFFWKIIAFFKRIFGLSKIIMQSI